jgi:hypothetical protein
MEKDRVPSALLASEDGAPVADRAAAAYGTLRQCRESGLQGLVISTMSRLQWGHVDHPRVMPTRFADNHVPALLYK